MPQKDYKSSLLLNALLLVDDIDLQQEIIKQVEQGLLGQDSEDTTFDQIKKLLDAQQERMSQAIFDFFRIKNRHSYVILQHYILELKAELKKRGQDYLLRFCLENGLVRPAKEIAASIGHPLEIQQVDELVRAALEQHSGLFAMEAAQLFPEGTTARLVTYHQIIQASIERGDVETAQEAAEGAGYRLKVNELNKALSKAIDCGWTDGAVKAAEFLQRQLSPIELWRLLVKDLRGELAHGGDDVEKVIKLMKGDDKHRAIYFVLICAHLQEYDYLIKKAEALLREE